MGELIVNGIKWGVIIGITITFATAIITLLNLLFNIASTSVIGEVMGIISNTLPFNATAVFGGIYAVMAGILSFIVAKKIWSMTTTVVGV